MYAESSISAQLFNGCVIKSVIVVWFPSNLFVVPRNNIIKQSEDFALNQLANRCIYAVTQTQFAIVTIHGSIRLPSDKMSK